MNTKQFFSVSRKALLTLTCIFALGLAACSGGDDEPSVDELLSEETTPITFDLTKTGKHILFDYAGNRLVGSDTIDVEYTSQKSQTIDLRQGKHRLVWFRGFYEGGEGTSQITYDTTTDMIMCKNVSLSSFPEYCIKELDVGPYPVPKQVLEYKPLYAGLSIVLECPANDNNYFVYVKDIPFVFAIGLDDDRCKMQTIEENYLPFFGMNGKWSAQLGTDILCPANGLNDIQIRYEVTNYVGEYYTVPSLPRISLRRGFLTTIKGPLVGGTREDFSVSIEPF